MKRFNRTCRYITFRSIVFLILILIVNVSEDTLGKVEASDNNKPSLTAYKQNNHVKLEWAVEMLDEDVLYQTGFEEGDELPNLIYGTVDKSGGRTGGQSFTTEESYTGARSLKVVDAYKNGQQYGSPVNGEYLFSNLSRTSFKDKKYVDEGIDLSISMKVKSDGVSRIDALAQGVQADFGKKMEEVFLEDVKDGDYTAKVSDITIFKKYVDSGRLFYLADRKGEYTRTYVKSFDEKESTITVEKPFRDNFKEGDNVLGHTQVTPLSFPSREFNSRKWITLNMNTKVPKHDNYDIKKGGFSLTLHNTSRGIMYIDDVKMGYATNTKLYRDDIEIYEGMLSDFEDKDATDKAKPNKVVDYNVTKEGDKQVVNVVEPKDNGTKYNYKLEAISNDESGTYTSDIETVDVVSGIKGYSYVIDKNKATNPTGTINSTDGKIKLDKDVYKEHYLHIQAIDNEGNKSEVSHIKLDKVKDITPPTVELSQTPTDWTNGNVTINVDAKDKESGIKSINDIGENMIKNGDFSEGDKYWVRPDNHVGESNVTFEMGKVIFHDTVDGLRNRIYQTGLFDSSARNVSFYAEVVARGKGEINARYLNNTGDVNSQSLKDEKEYDMYKFILQETSNSSYNGFLIERIGHGYMEVTDVKIYAQKDITDSRKLEVTDNGTYKFVVEDNAGNITTESITIDNIDKTPPTVEIKPNTTETTHENVILNVDAKDEGSGVKEVFIKGKNTSRNGGFTEGTKYWRQSSESGKHWDYKDGVVVLENLDGRKGSGGRGSVVVKLFQDKVLTKGLREAYTVKIRARGNGKLNARYSVAGTSGLPSVDRGIMVDSDTWEEYLFHVPYDKDYADRLMVELLGKGEVFIDNIEMYEGTEIRDSKVEIYENGTYEFHVVDNAGNITTETYEVTNIDKTLSFDSPNINDFGSVMLGEVDTVSTDVSPVIVKDWREGNNEWKVNVQATNLTNGKHTLPNGMLMLDGLSDIKKVDGSGSLPTKGFTGKKAIDEGQVNLATSKNARGEYELTFPTDALEIKVDPSIMKKGTYESTISWELVNAP